MTLFFCVSSPAQSYFNLSSSRDYRSVRFKLISNLIVLPVEINGVELSFILDTGVNKPILFDLTSADSLKLKNTEAIYIRGLGGGEPIKAYKANNNVFRIKKDIVNYNEDIYLILDQDINFAPRLGVPIHGIIGFELFRDFVVEINYSRKKIKFYRPGTYKHRTCRRCQTFQLDLIHNKPYLRAAVDLNGRKDVDVKLLIDSGSSDALWLFKKEEEGLVTPENHFADFLGRGLSGSIYGNRARVDKLSIGQFELEEAKVAFPDSISIQHLQNLNERDGSLGAEVLKRFNIAFDYSEGKITLRRNRYFKAPFKYNMSGIELQHNGIRVVRELESNIRRGRSEDAPSEGVKIQLNRFFKYSLHPAFEIAEIREGSPACLAGLQKGDVILSVNGKATFRRSLHEVTEMLNVKPGKRIRLEVERKGKNMEFHFELKKVL
ncbi:aspartyl protease family protein [Sinomicrobium kalidii]|uniref:pepsin/retropepsin-like aspartic protease family protein n=1 Tax=Sinomicrobium kalidii TaxID=2900738 RepID=UPI001E3A0DBC|nr:aspartyl protease family protein [Sinomicrobium kalidii]UGU14960.1 aspartyl protease family protein [Sinomicrobium kalidii]